MLLEKQEDGRQESHGKIVTDIDNIKQNIDQVWQKVGKLLYLEQSSYRVWHYLCI